MNFDLFLELHTQGFKLLPREDIIQNYFLLHNESDINTCYKILVNSQLSGRVSVVSSFNSNIDLGPDSTEICNAYEDVIPFVIEQDLICGHIAYTTYRECRLDDERERRKASKEFTLKYEPDPTTDPKQQQQQNKKKRTRVDKGEEERITNINVYNESDGIKKSNKRIKTSALEEIKDEDYDEVDDYIKTHENDYKPIIYDITQLYVWYKETHRKGYNIYRVFEQSSSRTIGIDGYLVQLQTGVPLIYMRELKHIKIFQTRPIIDNKITSPIQICKDLIQKEAYYDTASAIAVKMNANPLLPIETVPTAIDQTITAGLGGDGDNLDGGGYSDSIRSTLAAEQSSLYVNPNTRNLSSKGSYGLTGVLDQGLRKDIAMYNPTNHNVINYTNSIFKLPPNTKISTYTQPIPPAIQMEYKLHKMQKIYQIFDIPYSIMLNYIPMQTSSTSGASGTSKLGSGQSHSITSSAYMMFKQSKDRVTRWVTTLLQLILDETTLEYRNIIELKHIRLLIQLPGIPTLELVLELFEKGLLKHEAFVRYTEKLGDFKKGDFYSEQEKELTIKEMNGILPPPPSKAKT